MNNVMESNKFTVSVLMENKTENLIKNIEFNVLDTLNTK